MSQAEHALRLYFEHFLQRTDWHRAPASAAIDAEGRVTPLSVLDELRLRLRSRHYALGPRTATSTGPAASSTTWHDAGAAAAACGRGCRPRLRHAPGRPPARLRQHP
ncbi:MAG: hypothetical protein R2712_27160 [Vicinamibacterales bacterium]